MDERVAGSPRWSWTAQGATAGRDAPDPEKPTVVPFAASSRRTRDDVSAAPPMVRG